MRFDDRLSTVLGLSAEAPRDRAVQWRQLVELVARGAGANDEYLLQRALERIAALNPEMPDAVRAAASRAIAGSGPPPSLVTLFVDRTDVAAPLLASAEFGEEEWAGVRKAASPEVRKLMDTLRPLELAVIAPEPAAARAAPVQPTRAPSRDAQAPSIFRWECGPTGEIDWVEGAPRAALIGRSVAEDFQQRFAARLPFSEEALVLDEGLLAGEWKWSGTPAFFPDTGRFAGYHGSAHRGEAPDLQAVPDAEASDGSADSNRLRELIHELRTPLTAIIGFGEIIEGQILGPAHRAYRNRAGEIVRQARRLLAAVDDLDLAAKIQSGQSRTGTRTPVATLLTGMEALLRADLDSRGVKVSVARSPLEASIKLESGLAERLLRRFVEAVASAANEGEALDLAVEAAGGHIGFVIDRPRSLEGETEEQLLSPGFGGSGAHGLGTGFALRLTRGLAIIAGGGLTIERDRIVLRLPAAR